LTSDHLSASTLSCTAMSYTNKLQLMNKKEQNKELSISSSFINLQNSLVLTSHIQLLIGLCSEANTNV